MTRHRFGWITDSHDNRDLRADPAPAAVRLPRSVDLRPLFPPVFDQGELSSCVGNACAAALCYARAMQGLDPFVPSRLMLYWGARTIEGTTDQDIGCQIRSGIKAAARWGACPETMWRYDPAWFAVAPTETAMAAALKDRAIGYRRVPQDLATMRATLAAGDPVVFGMAVTAALESDEVARTGVLPMPAQGEPWLAKHAVVAVGYDDGRQAFLIRNSWSAEWGDAGHFWLPFEYMASPSLTADHWSIRLVTPAES